MNGTLQAIWLHVSHWGNRHKRDRNKESSDRKFSELDKFSKMIIETTLKLGVNLVFPKKIKRETFKEILRTLRKLLT